MSVPFTIAGELFFKDKKGLRGAASAWKKRMPGVALQADEARLCAFFDSKRLRGLEAAETALEALREIAAAAEKGRVLVAIDELLQTFAVSAGGWIREVLPILPEGALARIGGLFLRAPARVMDEALSPDGRVLARASAAYVSNAARGGTSPANAFLNIATESPLDRVLPSAEARLWDLESAAEICRLQGHTAGIAMVEWSPDGSLIATGGDDRSLCLWDSRTGRLLWKRVNLHKTRVRAVAFSPNGAVIASSGGDTVVKLSSAQTGRLIEKHTLEREVVALGFTDESRLEAQLRVDHSSGQTTTNTSAIDSDQTFGPGAARPPRAPTHGKLGAERLQGGRSAILGLAFSASGERLFSIESRGDVRAWDVRDARSPREEWSFQSCSPSRGSEGGATFSPGGALLAVCSYSNLRIFDVETRSQVGELNTGTGDSLRVAFTPDGKRVAATGTWGGLGSAGPWMWALDTGELLSLTSGLSDFPIFAIAFSQDGAHYAQAEAKGRVDVCEIASGNRSHWFKDAPSSHFLSFARGGARLVSITERAEVRVYHLDEKVDQKEDWAGGDVMDQFFRPKIRIRGFEGPTARAALIGDGDALVAVDRNGLLGVWDLETFERRRTYARGHERAVRSLACSPDGSLIATGGEDGSIVLWPSRTGARAI